MQHIDKLFQIAKRKSEFDNSNPWYSGSQLYLTEMKNEVDEVVEEIPKHRRCYLEDELGDVLWDYFNAILSLEKEAGVTLDSIIARACRKYEERVGAIENGIPWDDVKQQQKKQLADEYANEK